MTKAKSGWVPRNVRCRTPRASAAIGRVLATLSAMAVLPMLASAQSSVPAIDGSGLDLAKIRLVQPPAQVLLQSSATIQRPGTAQELGLSLLSSSAASAGVPTGLSLESTPVLLSKGARNISTDEYYRNSLLNILWRRVTISIATQKGDSAPGALAPAANAAIGLRTMLYDSYHANERRLRPANERTQERQEAGLAAERLADSLMKKRDTIALLHRELAALDSAFVRQTAAVVAAGPASSGPLRHQLEADLARASRLQVEVQALAQEMTGIEARATAAARKEVELVVASKKALSDAFAESQLVGFRLEAALGVRGQFPTGAWQSAAWDGLAVWLTPNYRAANGLEISAIGRLLTRVREYDDNNLLDVGGRLDYNWQRLAIGFEGVKRWVGSSQDSAGGVTIIRLRSAERFTGIVEYRLLESAKLVASFGSDFSRPTADGGSGRPVLSTLGLTFGFGRLGIVPATSGAGS